MFGPPIGGTWQPTDQEKADFPEVVPLVPNDWTVLHPAAPKGDSVRLVDWPATAEGFRSIADRQPEGLPTTRAAWHGTLLPKTDADLWLTEGFAAYERVVAFEQTLRDGHDGGDLTAEEKDRLAVEMNLYAAVVRRIPGRTTDAPDEGPVERSQLVRRETARGVLRLAGLRQTLGDRRFLDAMDAFGRQHAGKAVSTGDFLTFVSRNGGKAAGDLAAIATDGPKFTVKTWAQDPEETVIVYGTAADPVANRETAEQLQKTVARRGANIVMPVLSDTEAVASPDRVTSRHVILIGGPAANKLAARWRELFPVKFGTGSFAVRGEEYAHPGSAVLAAGDNPLDHTHAAVVIAGLSAESTALVLDFVLSQSLRPGNVMVVPNQARARSLVIK